MRILASLLLLAASLSQPCAHAAGAELTLQGYQRADGAITTYFNGDSVDPYFASKALLAAQDAGISTSTTAQRWIAWLLPRQHPDGRFDRYCMKGQQMTSCQLADADDALMAAWMELLVRSAPKSGLPPAWRASFDKASQHLETLRNPKTRVYHISASLPVALLMDNVEVSSAFKAVGRYRQSQGDNAGAEAWMRKAGQLDRDILSVFWRGEEGYLVSTQQPNTNQFYPDAVAQIFPILADIRSAGRPRAADYGLWMQQHRMTWLGMSEVDYPWGLVALIADKMNDKDAIACWRMRSVQFRHGSHWNVLEEALYVAFEKRLTPDQALAPPPAGLKCR